MANPLAIVQTTERGAVVMDPATGECFELNRIGAETWSLLARGERLAEISRILASKYQVPESDVARDIRALFADLAQHGLVVPRHNDR